jgi:tripeptide aminopeptidase
VSAHPGFAKDKMVNALHLTSKIVMMLPQVTMTPDTTEGTEGFIHVSEIMGGSSEAEITLIIRDFEMAGLEAKGALLRQVCETVAATEPRAQIKCDITPQYRNMRYWLEKDMTPVELVRAAVTDVGLEPVSIPIRGGTDGSRLTEMGVPCPNVFTGMQEIHGPLEWISVQDMALATKVAIALARRTVT